MKQPDQPAGAADLPPLCPVAQAEVAFAEAQSQPGATTRTAILAAIAAYQDVEAILLEIATTAPTEVPVTEVGHINVVWGFTTALREVAETEHGVPSYAVALGCLELAATILAEKLPASLVAAVLRGTILCVQAGEFDPADVANMMPPSAARN